jgi:arrestin-related trafficking adapter 3/6
VDGLADYFARLANYDDGDSDSGDEDLHLRRSVTRNGRVNVANPRTPGAAGRIPSRSLELERPSLPLTLSMAGALSERRN